MKYIKLDTGIPFNIDNFEYKTNKQKLLPLCEINIKIIIESISLRRYVYGK